MKMESLKVQKVVMSEKSMEKLFSQRDKQRKKRGTW